MHLYFPVWTVFAIGITFATLGCCVTQVYALKTMKLPPFGVALGKPDIARRKGMKTDN